MSVPPTMPVSSAKNQLGVDEFTGFMRRLMAVPHSELKSKLDAEKVEKQKVKTSASRTSGAPSKRP